jgi:hypothetical protein
MEQIARRHVEASIYEEATMKLNVIALALAAGIAGVGFAHADSVTVKSGTNGGVVIKERDNPDVVVRKRTTVGAGHDCVTKKTSRTNAVTDRKVTKTTKRCD